MRKIAWISFCLIIIALVWFQCRHFYELNNKTFTVWKRNSGKCYITPYRYWGIMPPKEDFIITPNLSSITICVKNDSLIIFDEDFTECSEGEVLECHFKNYHYKYVHSDDFLYVQNMRRIYLRNYPYLSISIGDLHIDKKDR